ILGIVLVICGWIGIKRPKIGVHIALVVALLGVIGTFSRVLQLGDLFAGTAEVPLAVISSTLTFLLLIPCIIADVRSFLPPRRAPPCSHLDHAHRRPAHRLHRRRRPLVHRRTPRPEGRRGGLRPCSAHRRIIARRTARGHLASWGHE